jgi:hypothetical protein
MSYRFQNHNYFYFFQSSGFHFCLCVLFPFDSTSIITFHFILLIITFLCLYHQNQVENFDYQRYNILISFFEFFVDLNVFFIIEHQALNHLNK